MPVCPICVYNHMFMTSVHQRDSYDATPCGDISYTNNILLLGVRKLCRVPAAVNEISCRRIALLVR